MMQTDVSLLFLSNRKLKDRTIADGVSLQYVQELQWWKDVRKLDRVKQKVELAGYNHRFFVSLPGIGPSSDGVAIENARQLILRTIVLSRIVRPNLIASGGLWIETEDRKNGDWEHRSYVGHGEYGLAYVSDKNVEPNLTDDDLKKMVDLWPRIQRLFQDEPKYRRIVRALKFFDAGFHLWCAEFRHLIFHAALESMICRKGKGRNRRQVVDRLIGLVPTVTEQQAIEIYERCCDIKHAAAPFPDGRTNKSASDDTNSDRYDSLNRLEDALRTLFLRILDEPKFAEKLIADPAALAEERAIKTVREKQKN